MKNFFGQSCNKALFITIPHSGEQIPHSCEWLKGLPEEILMRDVDRYVDQIFETFFLEKQISVIKSLYHRYAVDLNRWPQDVDASSVVGSSYPSGKHTKGFHWVRTTHNETLMERPMSEDLHHQLVKEIFDPFHQRIQNIIQYYREENVLPEEIYHLDLHSMPSLGTLQHKDPGEQRADIVISDHFGRTSSEKWVNHIILSFVRAGFKVSYNWPYSGGRLTEFYGSAPWSCQSVQIELNRGLYLDEKNHLWIQNTGQLKVLKKKLSLAVKQILDFFTIDHNAP